MEKQPKWALKPHFFPLSFQIPLLWYRSKRNFEIFWNDVFGQRDPKVKWGKALDSVRVIFAISSYQNRSLFFSSSNEGKKENVKQVGKRPSN